MEQQVIQIVDKNWKSIFCAHGIFSSYIICTYVATDSLFFPFRKEMDEQTDDICTYVHTVIPICEMDGQTHVTHVHKFFGVDAYVRIIPQNCQPGMQVCRYSTFSKKLNVLRVTYG